MVARWVLYRGLRHPAVGLLGGLLVALVPLQARLSPLGDLGLDPAWRLAEAWMVPVGLLGAALALGALGTGSAFLELLPPRARLAGEGLALGGAMVALQLPLVLGTTLVAQAGPGLAPGVWLATNLQAVAVGVLLLRWRAAASVRVGVFAGLLWVAPAMLPATGGLANALRLLTDLEGHDPTPSAWIARGLTVLALFLASALLVSRHLSRDARTDPR